MNYYEQESDRLKFRKLTESDIPDWIEFFINNDRLHFLGMDTSKSNEDLAKEWITIQLNRYENDEFGHLAIELKESNEFIGMAGILPRVLNDNHEYEVAYSLKPNYWGKGYATEMAKKIKDYAMNNVESTRFISIIHIDNLDSMNVAKKNGMKALFRTEFHGMDVEVYGIERYEWDAHSE